MQNKLFTGLFTKIKRFELNRLDRQELSFSQLATIFTGSQVFQSALEMRKMFKKESFSVEHFGPLTPQVPERPLILQEEAGRGSGWMKASVFSRLSFGAVPTDSLRCSETSWSNLKEFQCNSEVERLRFLHRGTI